jgi:aminoglycoside phosphotransferase (APT) family kinase protein
MDDQQAELSSMAARVLPGAGPPRIQRAESGGSTPVYRIERAGTTLYLRLAEKAEAGLAPEVLVHELLRSRGARVPEVVHFEPFNSVLQRSVMVTTAIAGEPIAFDVPLTNVSTIVEAAGRDLAVINSLEVEGFGWIRRDLPLSCGLHAEVSSLHEFALAEVPLHLAQVSGLLSELEINSVEQVVSSMNDRFERGRAALAHGDLDASHIFQHNGEYSGIIDFGEIRGTDRFYDLGHFALHDGEKIQVSLLPSLLEGYGEIAELPADHLQRIHFWSLLIGVRALGRSTTRPPSAYQLHLVMAIRRALTVLQG